MGQKAPISIGLGRSPSHCNAIVTDEGVSRLEAIYKQAAGRVRIVLHGTNGFEDTVTQRSISAGVSKINVNRNVLDDYNKHLKARASALPQTVLIDEGIAHVINLQSHQMDVCGSSGRA